MTVSQAVRRLQQLASTQERKITQLERDADERRSESQGLRREVLTLRREVGSLRTAQKSRVARACRSSLALRGSGELMSSSVGFIIALSLINFAGAGLQGAAGKQCAYSLMQKGTLLEALICISCHTVSTASSISAAAYYAAAVVGAVEGAHYFHQALSRYPPIRRFSVLFVAAFFVAFFARS